MSIDNKHLLDSLWSILVFYDLSQIYDWISTIFLVLVLTFQTTKKYATVRKCFRIAKSSKIYRQQPFTIFKVLVFDLLQGYQD